MDRKAQVIQPSEHPEQWAGYRCVDDQLAGLDMAVEAQVADGQKRSREGATGQPGCHKCAAASSARRGAGGGWIEPWNATSTSGSTRILITPHRARQRSRLGS
jgi:hypothetical protein